MAAEVGQKAPDFDLVDTEGAPVSLSGMAGKTTVIAFFPAAFSGVCQAELCSFRDSLAEFNGLGAQVVGISVDSRFANGAFAAQNKLNFPILSDHQRKTINDYGVVHTGLGGMDGYVSALRSVFVVDGTGKVAWRWIAEAQGNQPPYDEVKKAVQSLS